MPRTCFGRAYEYFLSGFAGAEGKRGGEFSRPALSCACSSKCWSPIRGASTIPAAARAACSFSRRNSSRSTADGSTTLDLRAGDATTRLGGSCKMNLAVRGIDADIKWNNEGSFRPGRILQCEVRLHPCQSALQRLGLVAGEPGGRHPLGLRDAAAGQRQLCVALAHLPPSRAARYRGRGARQWLDVFAAIRRRRDPRAR